MDGPANNDEVG